MSTTTITLELVTAEPEPDAAKVWAAMQQDVDRDGYLILRSQNWAVAARPALPAYAPLETS